MTHRDVLLIMSFNEMSEPRRKLVELVWKCRRDRSTYHISCFIV